MTIHPSLVERVAIDEREYNTELVSSLKRSYSYVGPFYAKSRPAEGDEVCNVFRMVVNLAKPYWTEEVGTGLWGEVREWLTNKLYKVGSTIANYNKTARKEGKQQPIHFNRLELQMKPWLFDFALPDVDVLPEADFSVARFRVLLNQGAFEGMDIERILMPSDVSLADQIDAARAQAEADALAAAEAEAAAQAAAEAAEAEKAMDAEAPVQQEAAEVEGGSEAAEVAETTVEGEAVEVEGAEGVAAEADVEAAGAEEPAKPAEPEAVLKSIDYTIWEFVMTDGSRRVMDSSTGEWL